MQNFIDKFNALPEKLLQFLTEPLMKFKSFPQKTQRGILYLFAAWAWFMMTLYMVLGEINARIIIAGVAVCFVVAKGYNWGRMLCLMVNVMAFLYCGVFVIHFWNQGLMSEAGLMTVNVIAFPLATYYLALKESADHFKSLTPKLVVDKKNGETGGTDKQDKSDSSNT